MKGGVQRKLISSLPDPGRLGKVKPLLAYPKSHVSFETTTTKNKNP